LGIGRTCFADLAEFSARFRPEGPALMLGRQEFRLRRGGLLALGYQRALSRHRPGLRAAAMIQADGYAETMFDLLGFPGIEVMDAADYEFDPARGGILHDLNLPVPEALHGRYRFIFDGGTLEHVFNLPQAFANLFHLLAPGGRLFATNPLNGWPGHGMYQFTPELIYAFWKRSAGCRVLTCRATAWRWGSFRRDLADPADTGRRARLRSWRAPFWSAPPGRLMLQYEVEKGSGAGPLVAAQQSDYAARWAGPAAGAQA
jgi:hypothetical protein